MRALSIVDSLFLWLENTKQPMHVAGICVFELPNDQDEISFINVLANQIDSDAIPNFPFNQVLFHKFAWKTIRKFISTVIVIGTAYRLAKCRRHSLKSQDCMNSNWIAPDHYGSCIYLIILSQKRKTALGDFYCT